jgi:hypothetical protein
MATLGGREGHITVAANSCVIYSTLDLYKYNALATGNVSPKCKCNHAAKKDIRPSLALEIDTHLIDMVKFS